MKQAIKWLLILTFITLPSGAFSEMTPKELEQETLDAIKLVQEVQSEGNQWVIEQEKLLAEIRDKKNTLRWLVHQRKKHDIYIEKQEKAILELQRRQEEFKRIRMNMEPFLDEVVVRTESFIANDLNFLTKERKSRIEFIKNSLNNYHISLSEKLRRVLEMLQVEAEYGRSLEKTEAGIILNGVSRQVNLLRLGRLSLFYQTLDGQKIGYWDSSSNDWRELPGKYKHEISKAMEIADRRRAVDIVNLPVGRDRQ